MNVYQVLGVGDPLRATVVASSVEAAARKVLRKTCHFATSLHVRPFGKGFALFLGYKRVREYPAVRVRLANEDEVTKYFRERRD